MTVEARKLYNRMVEKLNMPTDYQEWTAAHALCGVPACERDYSVIDAAFWALEVPIRRRAS